MLFGVPKGSRHEFIKDLARDTRRQTRPEQPSINHALEYGIKGLHEEVNKIRALSDRAEYLERKFLNVISSPRPIDDIFLSEAISYINGHDQTLQELIDRLNSANANAEPEMQQDESFRWMLKPEEEFIKIPDYLKRKFFQAEVRDNLDCLKEMTEETAQHSSRLMQMSHNINLNKEFSNIRDRLFELDKFLRFNRHPRQRDIEKITAFLGKIVLDHNLDKADKIFKQMDEQTTDLIKELLIAKLPVFYGVPLTIIDHLNGAYKEYYDGLLEPVMLKGLEKVKNLHPAFEVKGLNTRMLGSSWLRIAMTEQYPCKHRDGSDNVFIRSLRNIDDIKDYDNQQKKSFEKESHRYGLGKWCEFRTLIALLQVQDELEHKMIRNPKKINEPRLITKIIPTKRDSNADHNNIDFWIEAQNRHTWQVSYIPLQVKHSERKAKESRQGSLGVDSISIEDRPLAELRDEIKAIIKKPKHKISDIDFRSLYSGKLNNGDYRSRLEQIYSRSRS